MARRFDELAPMIGIRRIHDADLFGGPADALEQGMVDIATASIERVRTSLPDPLTMGSPVELSVDGPRLLDEITAVAFTGGGTFRISVSEASGRSEAVSDGDVAVFDEAGAVADRLRAGDTILAEHVERYAPSIADLHDRIVAGWNTKCSVAVALSSTSTALTVPERSHILVLTGAVEVTPDVGAANFLSAGQAIAVPSGPVVVAGDGLASFACIELETFDARSVLRQIERSSGFRPTFRADLPRYVDEPFTSYAGSLLDGPDTFQAAMLELFDDGAITQSLHWWDASLEFSPGSMTAGLLDGPVRVRWPAAPAFTDRRLDRGRPDDLAFGIAGHLVVIDADRRREFIDLVSGDFELADHPFHNVLRSLRMLVPA